MPVIEFTVSISEAYKVPAGDYPVRVSVDLTRNYTMANGDPGCSTTAYFVDVHRDELRDNGVEVATELLWLRVIDCVRDACSEHIMARRQETNNA
jgi:hypothetical protein